MVCKRIQVFGKVQGVFYRASAKTKADDFKLVGWVRNEADGSVAMIIQGDEKRIADMVKWCKEGPTFSRVDQVMEESSEEISDTTFEIVY